MPFATAVPLGQGGTGEVLKAWDEERGCYVALKLLHRADPESLARLQREARAQSRLKHPNICDVYEVSETSDGRPFIAMRFVDGRPIDEALANEPLERKVEVLAEVAETVQAAHAESLIHRDLKPGNILVERLKDGRLHPFVLDFGLVRTEGVPGATATGEVLGTPGYLSPEQASGSRNLDRRSDIFSLGILLYELIAESNPFLGTSKVDSLMRSLEASPPRLRVYAPQVPVSLEAIVEKALEKEPSRRYESSRSFAEDLRAYLDGRPVKARPTTWVTRARRRMRRHPRATAVVFSALLAVLAVFSVWRVGERRAKDRSAYAEKLAQRAGDIEAKVRFAQLLPTHDVSAAMASLDKDLEQLRGLVEAGGALAEGSGDYALGRALLALGRPQSSVGHLRRAFDAGHSAEGLTSTLARGLASAYGERQSETAGTPGARDALRAELSQDVERYLISETGTATDPWSLALVAFHSGDTEGALEHARRAAEEEPWRFEADLLETSIQRDRALDLLKAGAHEEAQTALAELRASALRAAAKAPSAAEAFYRLCDAAPLAARFVRLADQKLKIARLSELEEQARLDCARTLEIEPERFKAPLRLGMLINFLAYESLRLGESPDQRLAEVERLASQSLEIEEQNAGGYALRAAGRLTRASHALNLGRAIDESLFEGAVSDMERALELRPGRPFEWEWLGASYAFWAFARGDAGLPSSLHLYDASVAAYGKALDLGAYSPVDVHLAICEVEARAGEEAFVHGVDPLPALSRARVACGRVFEIAPDDSRAHTQLAAAAISEARMLSAQGQDSSSALKVAHRALDQRQELAPDDPEDAMLRARTYLLEAVVLLDQGESASPSLVAAHDALAAAEQTLPRDYRLLSARTALLTSMDNHRAGGAWKPEYARATRLVEDLVKDFSSPLPPAVEHLAVELRRRGGEMFFSGQPQKSRRLVLEGLDQLAKALERRPAHPELLSEGEQLRGLAESGD